MRTSARRGMARRPNHPEIPLRGEDRGRPGKPVYFAIIAPPWTLPTGGAGAVPTRQLMTASNENARAPRPSMACGRSAQFTLEESTRPSGSVSAPVIHPSWLVSVGRRSPPARPVFDVGIREGVDLGGRRAEGHAAEPHVRAPLTLSKIAPPRRRRRRASDRWRSARKELQNALG